MKYPLLTCLLLAALLGPPHIDGRAAEARPSRLGVITARLDPAAPAFIGAPVTLTVQFDQTVLLASWQWVAPDGHPVPWAGDVLPASDLRPVQDHWEGRAAIPPLPGSYSVQVKARANGGGEQTFTLNLGATAVPDPHPITRGVAYSRDGNLWLRTLDLGRERAITFYGRPGTAGMPAWAPDGRAIAFIRDPGRVDSTTELWLINPDGTGGRKLAGAAPGRTLAYPAFGSDAALYVTQSRPLSFGGLDLGDTWDIERVDVVTGHLTPVLAGAAMPDLAPDGARLVYLQQTVDSDGFVTQGLAVASTDGSNEQVLIPGSATTALFAPTWAPDGRTIVFAAQGLARAGAGGAGLAAPARHGGIWDLWAIDARGGSPRLFSPVQEDLPFPRWAPDGRHLYFISPTGLWQVPAAGDDPVRVGDSAGHAELAIFAPIPRPAAPLPGAVRCFGETSHCLRGRFLQYWASHGALVQLGYPVSDELQEEGRTVQYTQRARLEWHPEYAGSPAEILLGRLGADVAVARAATGEPAFQPQAAPSGGGRYFPETRHVLAAPLRSYWEREGGLAVFGYPLSEAFREVSPTDGRTYLVQYFERNRLEYHPEYAGSDSEVLLGLLGVQEYARRYGP